LSDAREGLTCGRGSPAGGAHLREGLTCGRGSPAGGALHGSGTFSILDGNCPSQFWIKIRDAIGAPNSGWELPLPILIQIDPNVIRGILI